jgi:hypothetical protein
MNFNAEQAIDWPDVVKKAFLITIDLTVFIVLYATISENIADFSHNYLSDLPLIGNAFSFIAPDATVSDILSALVSLFVVMLPIVLWSFLLKEQVIQNWQEWISLPTNQIVASVACVLLLFSASIEVLSIYTLIAKAAAPTVSFAATQQSDFLNFVTGNKPLAIAISATVTLINLLVSLLIAASFHNLDPRR